MFFSEDNQRNKTLCWLKTSLKVLKTKKCMRTLITFGERISRRLNLFQQLLLLTFLCILGLLKTGCLQRNFLMRGWKLSWSHRGRVKERLCLKMLFRLNSNCQKDIKSKSQVNLKLTIQLTLSQQVWWNSKSKKIDKWM